MRSDLHDITVIYHPRKGTGFHPSDADWTRGRAIALSEADTIVRRQRGLARKISMTAPERVLKEKGLI